MEVINKETLASSKYFDEVNGLLTTILSVWKIIVKALTHIKDFSFILFYFLSTIIITTAKFYTSIKPVVYHCLWQFLRTRLFQKCIDLIYQSKSIRVNFLEQTTSSLTKIYHDNTNVKKIKNLNYIYFITLYKRVNWCKMLTLEIIILCKIMHADDNLVGIGYIKKAKIEETQ